MSDSNAPASKTHINKLKVYAAAIGIFLLINFGIEAGITLLENNTHRWLYPIFPFTRIGLLIITILAANYYIRRRTSKPKPKLWLRITKPILLILVAYGLTMGASDCVLGDSRDPKSYKNIEKVNLVITSPPYPNAYEYWLYHKYRMYWLGMDPIWSRTNEIGVRPHYSGSGKKNEWDFYRDISAVLSNIDAVTTNDALQFWVVGDSIIKGKAIDNTKIIVDAAKELGWKNIATYQRPINRKRSSFQGIGKKLHEDIIVLSR